MAFTVYRLPFSDPLQFYEQMGDPVTSTGGSPVPALRGALRHAVALANLPANVAQESVATRLKLRRQWRSLINNTPMKLQGIGLVWDADPENSGWYMPDQGQLVDIDGSVGLATGIFKVENVVWIVAGRPRTHRRARWVYLKDLRTAEWSRDFRRLMYITDFATLSPLALSYFPPGASDLLTTGGTPSAGLELPPGSDGGIGLVISNLIDLARVSYEQPFASFNLGQVVAYDRRGETTAPTGAAPGPLWEEVYGPDYPFSWLGGEGTPDTPVLENGRCRVRYDTTAAVPGLAIDVWNGSAWENQGKVTFGRFTGSNPLLTTWVSSTLTDYSETRATIQLVMRAPVDTGSREEIYVTLQQGWSGPRIEIYSNPNILVEKVDPYMQYALGAADSDDSAIAVDTGPAGVIQATAMGTGHTGEFVPAELGATTFTLENWISVGRWGAAYSVNIAALQALAGPGVTISGAYGGPPFRNAISFVGTGKVGWLCMQLGYAPQQSQQALECESMTLGAGTTSVNEGAASGGKAAQSSRTTDANPHVSQATWPNGDQATYRVFARVKATSGKLKIYAKTGGTTGATKEVTALATPTYVWVDLGEIAANNTTLEIHAWQSAAVAFQVDRVESFMTEDRVLSQGGRYQGARDLGQSVLYDSRVIPTIVARSV